MDIAENANKINRKTRTKKQAKNIKKTRTEINKKEYQ